MSLTKMFHNLGSLIPLSQADFNANDQEPQAALGALGFYKDAMGMRVMQYIKNNSSSALVLGDVVVKEADVTFTAGVLASATRITTTGLTADKHKGKLIIVEGNDTSAGAAPEGETGVITANTATVIDVDSQLPFSVSSVADIDCRILTPGWHGTQGGANAAARDVFGGVIGVDGISAGYYGWVVVDGYHPQMKFTAANVTALANCITAATGQLVTVGAATMEKVVGYAPCTIESTHPGKMPFVFTLLRARDVV